VITNDAEDRVTNRQTDAQIAVLHLAFAGFYGGTNTGFSFASPASTEPTTRSGSR
jgi:hypothetical protein